MASLQSVGHERALTSSAFRRLLEWLDDGVDSDGESYLEMRRRLVSYFDRRNRLAPEDLVDDTLNRVARKLEEAGRIEIRPPARYCYVVARFVFLENLRHRTPRHVPLDGELGGRTLAAASGARSEADADLREQRLECLDRCLQTLTPAQRELVLEYYRETGRPRIERRREMASRLGISLNALGIRAWRIRNGLERCVAGCRGNG